MCGIFGCVGADVIKKTLRGLKRLEYRGYDSSGMAGIRNGKLSYCKEVGKVEAMEKKVTSKGYAFDIAISQTRWATHGIPSKLNAHPHLDSNQTLAVIHNGIIENHSFLREELESKGVIFRSDTDTEVVAHLIAQAYEGDMLKALEQTLAVIRGSYALAVIHKDHQDSIFIAASQSPLAVGLANGESFISSDPNAFPEHVKEVLYLSDGEVGEVKRGSCELYDADMTPITKETQVLMQRAEEVHKGEYEHFTMKEIFEQPSTIRAALASRCISEYGTAIFDELMLNTSELLSVERILILACGTSLHAGMMGAYLLEDMARIPTQVEISSEFRYKNPVVPHGTLAIAISQSGETADTLAAVRELKAKGCRVLGVCNVHESSLSREADSTLMLRAGPEIGVCSTKAFSNQVVVMSLFALALARMRHMTKEEGRKFIDSLVQLPEHVQNILNSVANIEMMAKKYANFSNYFYLGRRYMFPAALEGALKVKEIAYVNANGYPAGEMKHGPIALISPEVPTVALCGNKATYEKMLSNLMEVKARGGPILAIAEERVEGLEKVADDIIWIPETSDELAIVPTSVVLQLFAYYVAREHGADIDQPRNLAKSVTVE